MSPSTATRSRPLWLGPLLAAVLLLVAGLDILLLGLIGWGAWQRATLSERYYRMQQEHPVPLEASQFEAQQLRDLIASSREVAAATLQALPTDTDVARHVTSLHAAAAVLGVTITELSPRPTRAGDVPIRRFAVQARGDWDALCQLVTYIAQTFPPACQIEGMQLDRQGAQAEIRFELSIAVRPPAALPPAILGDPHAVVP